MAKSAPKHFFGKFASVNGQRSRFDLSTVNTTTVSADYLIPVERWEVLPGDTFTMDVSSFMRLIAPIDVPMMDNLYCDYHFWYVPMRLVFNKTKQFFGEPDRDNPEIEYTLPQVTFSGSKTDKANACVSCSIGDYLHYPIHDGINIGASATPYSYTALALPFREYNLIYDEWYRDEQRCPYSYYENGTKTVDYNNYKLLRRGKRFDYFTSSLLEPQIGEPVNLPMSGSVPVLPFAVNNGMAQPTQDYVKLLNKYSPSGSLGLRYAGYDNETDSWKLLNKENFPFYNKRATLGVQVDGNVDIPKSTLGSSMHTSLSGELLNMVAPVSLYADMSNATSTSIIALRQAFQMQAYQELLSKGGQRYTEYIYSMFGVISPDARLQRPEFLGGMHFPLSVMPVVQNSSSTENSKQGNLSAIISGGSSKSIFTRSFTEHGAIMCIMNIYSDLTYYQGMPRDYSRLTPLDIAIPIFGNLSDQDIKRKEILFSTEDKRNDDIYGYVERYGEYKTKQNTLSGLVRPNAELTLGYWSLAQQFDNTLENNSVFIESNTPMSRITAVSDQQQFIVNHKFSCYVTRCLPLYADPMKWFMRG